MAIDNQPTDPNAPWGWVPSDWLDAAAAEPPPPVTVDATGTPILQPGLGIPASAVDNAIAAQANANARPPQSVEPEQPPLLQPGLGIPTSLIDDAMNAPTVPLPLAHEDAHGPVPFPPPQTIGDVLGPVAIDPSSPSAPPPIPSMPGDPYAAHQVAELAGAREHGAQILGYGGLGAPAAEPGAIPFAPTLRGNLDTTDDEYRADYGDDSDEDLAVKREMLARTATVEDLTRRDRASQENYERQQANIDAWHTADEQSRKQADAIFAEASRLSQQKITPDRRSTFDKIMGVLAAFLGGLAAPSMGGRNVGLEAVQHEIDQDIEVQKSDMANAWHGLDVKRAANTDSYARNRDRFSFAEASRLAWWERVDKELATKQQTMAPRGTQWADMEVLRRSVRAKKAEIAQAAQRQLFKDNIEVAKFQQDENKRIVDARATERRLGIEQQNANTSSYNARVGATKADDESKRGWEDLAIRRETAAAVRLKEVRETNEKERILGVGAPSFVERDEMGLPIVDENGIPQVKRGEPLLNADGTEYKARDPGEAAKLEGKIAATAEYVDIANRLLELRDRVGGESTTLNSDESQQMQVLEKRALILVKKGTQGMSSDADMENLATAAGTKDITSFRAKSAGLKEARDRAITGLHTEMGIARYTGKPLEFPQPHKQASTTAQDAEFRKLFLDAIPSSEFRKDAKAYDKARDAQRAEVDKIIAQANAEPPVLADSKDRIAAAAEARKQRDVAKAKLQQISDSVEAFDDVKEKANRALAALTMASTQPSSKEEVGTRSAMEGK